MTHIPLKSLVGQCIELTIRFSPVGHCDLTGRVRFVADGATLWVASTCFTEDTIVEVRTDSRDHTEYVLHLDVVRREISPKPMMEEAGPHTNDPLFQLVSE